MIKRTLKAALSLVLAGAALAGAGRAHAYETAPVRTADQHVPATDATLGSASGPAQGAPSLHTVTVLVTSIKAVRSMDTNSCGEFNTLEIWAGRSDSYADDDRANLVPKGAQLEYWNTAGPGWQGTVRLCEGSTYSVSQANLPQLAESLESWNGTGLFAIEPVAASNLNRLYTKALPGGTFRLGAFAFENDTTYVEGVPGSTWAGRVVTAPAASKCKTYTFDMRYDTFWGPRTSMFISSVICTSATPTS